MEGFRAKRKVWRRACYGTSKVKREKEVVYKRRLKGRREAYIVKEEGDRE